MEKPIHIVNCKDITATPAEGLFGGEGKFLRFPMYPDTAAPPFSVIAETEMAPGARVGLHVQPDQQELLYILTGAGHFHIDGDVSPVSVGDAILARAGTSFGLHNTGAVPLRYLVVKCKI